MPTLSSGIYIALSAVLSHSQAIEIIEHNVANANTVGYHRQSAVLSANTAAPIMGMEPGLGAGQRGTGVSVERIERFTIDFFDGRYRSALSEQQNWERQQEILTQMEYILAETGEDGLLTKLDDFFGSWQMVAADPSNTSLRGTLLANAGALSGAFNRRAEQLGQLQAEQEQSIVTSVGEVNKLASQIATLNAQISRVQSVGEQPNDLMDQRALLLDRLSGFSGATSHLQANGEVNVSIGGHILVNGHTTLELKAGTDLDGSGKLTVQWADGQAYNAFGGSLKGALNVYQNGIPQQLKVLDDMAVQLRDEVNAIHETGFGLDGSTGMQFFVGDTAQSLKVNPLLTAASLAVADAAAEPGNSIIADRIAALKTGKVLSSDTETFNQYYNKAVTQLGLSIQQAKDYSKSQKLVTEAMETQRESVAGVNLDEEAVNLAKYQKAYAAAARVMTTYDELLDLIINRMGRVGL